MRCWGNNSLGHGSGLWTEREELVNHYCKNLHQLLGCPTLADKTLCAPHQNKPQKRRGTREGGTCVWSWAEIDVSAATTTWLSFLKRIFSLFQWEPHRPKLRTMGSSSLAALLAFCNEGGHVSFSHSTMSPFLT